jgi:hypothetical protein
MAFRSSSAIRIDGSLDEAAWHNVPVATDFITNSPEYGKPASNKTEVKVIYDNTAIYVGAYVYDKSQNIRRQFTPRDQEREADVDYFAVFFDTYQDRQNAFQFLVTTRNVQSDARISPNAPTDYGVYGDLSWDAVWDSKVSIREDGWVVEMKIPLYSIRFSPNDIQNWGIQFLRFSRSSNETSFWNPVDPAVSGFVNQFGDITGIRDVVAPLRLSFSPYVSGGFRKTPYANNVQEEWLKSGGMDVKYGISESFTLDATLIPDFGQVVSDNVVNNISPFEIQFRENRPFFTEGTELFNKAGIFYSRRIGKTPDLYNSVLDSARDGYLKDFEIIQNPSITRLYNAIKLSGRTPQNLGIGVFNAVARSERARLVNRYNGKDTTITTELLTNYNVFVLDQALRNRSYLTLTNTNVLRDGHGRDANVTALDVALYDRKNRYGLFIRPRYSKIFDSTGGYDGLSNYIEFGKVSGKFQFSISNQLVTQKYDPNDLGFLLSPNKFDNKVQLSYNVFNPTKAFLNQSYGITAEQSYLWNPFEFQKTEITAFAFWIFKNFWDLRIESGTAPGWFNDFYELQTPMDILKTPRQKLKRSPYYFLFLDGSSDSRKRLYVRWSLGGAEGPLKDDPFYKMELGARYRFSDRLSLDLSYATQHDNGQFGYAFLRDAMSGAPILARRRYTDVTTILTGIYNFTSRMNVSFRARHFWNRLSNTNLYNVKEDGYWVERFDLVPQDSDANYNAFNLDVFYTWDFRPGSRVILGWKNWLGQDFENSISGKTYNSYANNAAQIFNTPHGNEVTLRFIYFLDYMQLRGKR